MNEHRPFADEGEVVTTFAEIRATLARIEAQTVKTNGRVRDVEQWIAIGRAIGALLILEVGWFIAIGAWR